MSKKPAGVNKVRLCKRSSSHHQLHEVNRQLQICLESNQHVVTALDNSASDLNLEIVAYSGWQSGTAAGSGEIGSSG